MYLTYHNVANITCVIKNMTLMLLITSNVFNPPHNVFKI